MTPKKKPAAQPGQSLLAQSKYLDMLLDTVCVVDPQGYFIYLSASCRQLFGYEPEEMIGKPMVKFIYPEDLPATMQTVSKIMSGQPEPHFENRYVRKDGSLVHIMWTARWSEEDQCRIAVARDVTPRKRAEAMQAAVYAISEAAQSLENLDTLFERIHQVLDGLLPAKNISIALYDTAKGRLSFPYHKDECNRPPDLDIQDSVSACTRVIESGQTLLLNSASDDLEHHSWLGTPLKSHKGIVGALVVQSYDPQLRYNESNKALLQYVSTQIANAIERKQMFAHLQHLALYDPLTNLPNRGLFHDRMQLALARAKRNQTQVALFFIDLDKFKKVNDTYGHAVGDLLLEQAARRLEKCVRASDTVARFGGDEFIVLLESINQVEQSYEFANNIVAAIAKPFELGMAFASVRASIGIAHFPQDGEDEAQLLRHADEAMYKNKRRDA